MLFDTYRRASADRSVLDVLNDEGSRHCDPLLIQSAAMETFLVTRGRPVNQRQTIKPLMSDLIYDLVLLPRLSS